MAARSPYRLLSGVRRIHPFSDFLLHDVGTGDGIVIPIVEHGGGAARQMPRNARQKISRRPETAFVRLRCGDCGCDRALMHDGNSLTTRDAVLRHAGEADQAIRGFRKLPLKDQDALLAFLAAL